MISRPPYILVNVGFNLISAYKMYVTYPKGLSGLIHKHVAFSLTGSYIIYWYSQTVYILKDEKHVRL